MSESAYDRILGELRETRDVLDAHLRPAAQRLLQAEIEDLVNAAREWQARLRLSSTEIDRCLKDCERHWAEMERACDELEAINDQLLGFGREAVFKREEFLSTTNLVGAIIHRLNKK